MRINKTPSTILSVELNFTTTFENSEFLPEVQWIELYMNGLLLPKDVVRDRGPPQFI